MSRLLRARLRLSIIRRRAAAVGVAWALVHSVGVPAVGDPEEDTSNDRCPETALLEPGGTRGAYYRTVAPFEHEDSARTQVFDQTCSLRELPAETGVQVRTAPGDYATPYIVSTRNRDELITYSYGSDAADSGASIAMVDARTLRERWRTLITDTTPRGQWSYPGVSAVVGDGAVVAVYGNQLVRLRARDGAIEAWRELPEDPDGSGAAYNGFVALSDGTLVLKGIERGACPLRYTDEGPLAFIEAFGGLVCASVHQAPTQLMTVDPRSLQILDVVTTPEPIAGRVTATRRDGKELVYLAGADSLIRYVVDDRRLRLDETWGPVRYRTGSATAGTGAGVMGDWVVVQTNFIPATGALQMTAVHQDEDRRVHRLKPFTAADTLRGLPLIRSVTATLERAVPVLDDVGAALGDVLPDGTISWIISKPALDEDSMTIVTHDTAVGSIAAVRLDPKVGLKVVWRRPLRSFGFSALVGPPGCRDIVQTDWSPVLGDRAVWLDLATGEELTRSRRLDPLPAPGNIVTPGFDGRFYYVGLSGALRELSPGGVRPHDAALHRSSRCG